VDALTWANRRPLGQKLPVDQAIVPPLGRPAAWPLVEATVPTRGSATTCATHFGPTNVAGWELSIAAENGGGPDAAERFVAAAPDLSVLGSKCREGYVRFALARCWSQAEGARDGEALRALDTADRLAPVVVRNDPIARNLVLTLDRRAKRQVWELDSLRHRFGVGGQRSHIGDN
jgi:hypothetical protein